MTYEAMVEDLKHLMTQQGIVDPVLIGHSMGGKVAMAFAQNYPEALHKLVVVDIAPRAYDKAVHNPANIKKNTTERCTR